MKESAIRRNVRSVFFEHIDLQVVTGCHLDADSLAYLSQEGMVQSTGLPSDQFCMACYDGDYPVPYDPLIDKHIIERRRNRIEGLGDALAKEELQIRLL